MKQLFVFFIISIILVTSSASANEGVKHTFIHDTSLATETMNRQYMIPDEAIRLRILAHSNNDVDQEIKYDVRNRVNAHIHELVSHVEHIEEARQIIDANVPKLNEIVSQTLQEYEKNYDYEVAFQKNVSFPLKTYGPYVYPAGEYEAILITLGEGLGDNWWCVLFPPLCFIDFFKETSLAEADDDEIDELNDDLLDDDEETTDDEITEEKTETSEEVEIRFFIFDLFKFS